ncbi:MAG: phage head morphogenesis protein [Eubacteriales bacterium]
MSNSEYWRKRFEQVTESELKKADMYQKILEREYQKAIVQIQKDIDTWYNRFAKDNKVTYAESKRMLNSKELQELKWTLDDYIKHGEENNINGKWVQQLKNASARVHISRLESLQIQLQQHAEVVFGNQLDDLDDVLRDIYESGYYHSIFEIQKGLGLGSSFTKLDTARINKVLSKPWADDGRDFSKRIWSNRTKLVNELHTGLTQALIRGEPVEKLAKRLSERFDVSKNRAVALVQTESAYFANAAQQDSFKEIGVDKLKLSELLTDTLVVLVGRWTARWIDGSDAKTWNYYAAVSHTVSLLYRSCC